VQINVKIVISALNDENYKEDTLYFQKLSPLFNSKTEIKRLTDPKQILEELLKQEDRTLTNEQFEYVLNKKDSNKPLYLTIAKEELKYWKSSDELTDNQEDEKEKGVRYLSSTQKEIIEEYINNLKSMHNIIPELVNKVLGYISISKEHLSEELLLEVLTSSCCMEQIQMDDKRLYKRR